MPLSGFRAGMRHVAVVDTMHVRVRVRLRSCRPDRFPGLATPERKACGAAVVHRPSQSMDRRGKHARGSSQRGRANPPSAGIAVTRSYPRRLPISGARMPPQRFGAASTLIELAIRVPASANVVKLREYPRRFRSPCYRRSLPVIQPGFPIGDRQLLSRAGAALSSEPLGLRSLPRRHLTPHTQPLLL
jgi:hypothetical protein